MAVENKYVNTNVAAGKLASAIDTHGSEVFALRETFEVAAADSDASVYRVFKGLEDTLVPLELTIDHDAITGGTDWDVGFYQTNLGAVIDKDILADGLDLSSAGSKNGITTVNIADRKKSFYELVSKTVATRLGSMDLCLTGNVVGSAAGTITVTGLFAHK